MIPGIFAAGAMGGGGPPPAGFPTFLSVTGSAFAFGTANNQSMPATVNAGDLLVVAITTNQSAANSAINTPAGWTALSTLRGGVSPRLTLLYKVAAGTEGGTTVNFSSAGNTEGSGQCFRIQAGTYSSTPESNTLLANSGTSHTPNSASPSWGSANTLFLVVVGFGSSSATITAYPYPTNNNQQTGGTQTASCTREEATGTLSPGAFTTSASVASITGVVSIRPV